MSYNTQQQALEEALKIAEKEKNRFETNLVGKTFAYAYFNSKTNKIDFKEVQFKTKNFLHLTGLDYKDSQYNKRVLGKKTPTYADDFFKRLGKDKTLINDVSFIRGQTPTETTNNIKNTQNKLKNLSQLVNIAQKAEYIGRYKRPEQYDLLINRNSESLALIKRGKKYIPISSRNGVADKQMDLKDKNSVLAIFSRKNSEREFKLVYLNKKVNNINKSLFDTHYLRNFSLASFINENTKFNEKSLSNIRHRYIVSAVKSELAEIADKRQKICDENFDKSFDEYLNAREKFIEHLKAYDEVESVDEKGEIVKVISAHYNAQLSNTMALSNADFIPDEIGEINKTFSKYTGLNLSVSMGDEAFNNATVIANAIKAPSSQLLKNKKSDFSLIPQKGRNELYNSNLHGVQLQGGSIALAMPNPPPSFNEIIRTITAQLSAVTQKISDFLSEPFKSSDQEQLPQARTAHERKITYGLPFPKKEPSEERVEPSMTKSDKVQQSEVKPAEKQSNWIGKMLSSAKREADANNQNHEVKHHDKDQSL